MKPIYLLFLLACNSAIGQITVDGTSTATSIANNAPAIAVDPALTVTTSLSIPQFIVKLNGYNPGDVLATTTTLPSGITAGYASGVLTITGAGTAAQYQQILRGVTFRTTSSVTTARSVVFQAGDGTVQLYDGHYYKIITGTYTFTNAKAAAAALSLFGWPGYLPAITSSAENSYIFNSIGKGWIGASDEFSEINAATGVTTYANQGLSENKWYWVTGPEKGTQFSNGGTVISGKYASWSSGEPNNSNGENYAENAYPNNGSWNDAQGSNSNNTLVEFGQPGFVVDIFHTRSITMIATQLNIAAPDVPYQLHDAPVAVDAAITGYSVSTFNAGRVTISNGFKTGDALTYSGTLPGTFSGTYNATTGVLTFSSSVAASIADWQALFRTVKFGSSSNVKSNRTVTFSLGNLVAFSNGHFYEYIGTAANWGTAKTSAEGRSYLGLHGYLVTIMSAAENEFIRQTTSADAWTGASDDFGYINAATAPNTYANQAASEGKWYWVTGPEKGTQMTTANAAAGQYPPVAGSTYNNWNLGEPNNSSSNEHAGTIYSSGANAGMWNDLNAASSLGYVVEYGGLSTDPLLQLTASRVIFINTILPVRDLEFSVKQTGADVKLDWSTSAETNSRNYEVLHSTDGNSYKSLGSVNAAGNTSAVSTYTWLHTQPAAGTHYYQLAQYDIDGAVHYSEVRTARISAGAFRLYPTVASSTVQVLAPGRVNSFSITVSTASGVRVISERISGQAGSVDVSKLAPGVYFAEVVKGSEREVFRIIRK